MNFYLVDGSPKRLFDRHDVAALFSAGREIEEAVERSTSRHGYEKTVWETVVREPVG